jgi:hypothetical protein
MRKQRRRSNGFEVDLNFCLQISIGIGGYDGGVVIVLWRPYSDSGRGPTIRHRRAVIIRFPVTISVGAQPALTNSSALAIPRTVVPLLIPKVPARGEVIY